MTYSCDSHMCVLDCWVSGLGGSGPCCAMCDVRFIYLKKHNMHLKRTLKSFCVLPVGSTTLVSFDFITNPSSNLEVVLIS